MGASDNLQPDQFKLQYARRKGSAPNMGETYGQHIEPPRRSWHSGDRGPELL